METAGLYADSAVKALTGKGSSKGASKKVAGRRFAERQKKAAFSGHPFYVLEFITGAKPNPKHPLYPLGGNKRAKDGGG